MFESGAILLYLAEKTGQFMPTGPRARIDVLQWLFWQVGGLGPMAGQNHHFNGYSPEDIPYARQRYVRETARLYGVLDRSAGLPRAEGCPPARSLVHANVLFLRFSLPPHSRFSSFFFAAAAANSPPLCGERIAATGESSDA